MGADLFFNFGPFEEEIEKKLITREMDSGILMEKLIRFLSRWFTGTELSRLEDLYGERLKDSAFIREAPHYLSHPIRVAASFASKASFLVMPHSSFALTPQRLARTLLAQD